MQTKSVRNMLLVLIMIKLRPLQKHADPDRNIKEHPPVMDHVATSKPCRSLHPFGTRRKHSCASSRDVCDGNCSVHACDRDVWEVSQAPDLLTVEAGTSLSPQTQAWDFPFTSPSKPLFGRHPHCRLQGVRISAGLSLCTIKYINTQKKMQCCAALLQLLWKQSAGTVVATGYVHSPKHGCRSSIPCLHGTAT